MYDLAGENELDVEALPTRLRRMSHKELLGFGTPRQQALSGLRNEARNRRNRPCPPLGYTSGS